MLESFLVEGRQDSGRQTRRSSTASRSPTPAWTGRTPSGARRSPPRSRPAQLRRAGAGDEESPRRPRRRPDRRLDRARGAASGSARRSSASTPTLRRATRRSRSVPPIASPTRCPGACAGAEMRLLRGAGRATWRSSPAPPSRPRGPDTVVTDVGSTKREIVAAVGADERFIGGHPLAGAETAGRRQRPRRPLRGRPLVPDPDRALRRPPLRPPAARDQRPRRPPPGDRRRQPTTG